MQLLISSSELTVQFNSSEFVLKTQRQIAKDFLSSGVEFPYFFTLDTLIKEQIISNLETALTEILRSNDLSQLLYQIDIPESTYVSLLNEPDFIAQLSELILRREAYKVYLRSQF